MRAGARANNAGRLRRTCSWKPLESRASVEYSIWPSEHQHRRCRRARACFVGIVLGFHLNNARRALTERKTIQERLTMMLTASQQQQQHPPATNANDSIIKRASRQQQQKKKKMQALSSNHQSVTSKCHINQPRAISKWSINTRRRKRMAAATVASEQEARLKLITPTRSQLGVVATKRPATRGRRAAFPISRNNSVFLVSMLLICLLAETTLGQLIQASGRGGAGTSNNASSGKLSASNCCCLLFPFR